MEKRKKNSSLTQYKGITGIIKKFLDSVVSIVFPPKHIFYINGGKNAVTPAMSRRQVSYVSRRICKAAIKGFGR